MHEDKGFLFRLGSGFLIAAGFLIPGISGGILALALGFYQPLLEVAARPLANLRRNSLFFLPFALGAALSLVLFSNLLRFLLANFPRHLLFFFLGLVAGGLPTVFKTANRQGFRLSYLTAWALGLACFLLFSRWHASAIFTNMILQGFFIGAGIVVPGLSVSFLLMAVGIYEKLLFSLTHWDWGVLIPLGLGALPGMMAASRALTWLFQRAYGFTYYALLGVLSASLLQIYPGLPRVPSQAVLSLVFFLGAFCLGAFLSGRLVTKKGGD